MTDPTDKSEEFVSKAAAKIHVILVKALASVSLHSGTNPHYVNDTNEFFYMEEDEVVRAIADAMYGEGTPESDDFFDDYSEARG